MNVDKKIPASGLEKELVELFFVQPERAKTAGNIPTDQFYHDFNELESILTFDLTLKVIQKGDYLSYRNGEHKKYLKLVRIVAAKCRQNGIIPPEMETTFYSIPLLTAYLTPPAETSSLKTEALQKNIGFYHILHKKTTPMHYLTKLIEKGELHVDSNEHWNDTRSARGYDILHNIDKQLKRAFADLGLERPKYTINDEKRIMILTDTKTREHLKLLRDVAYAIEK